MSAEPWVTITGMKVAGLNNIKEKKIDLHKRWEVEEASKNLVTQASTLSHQHADDLSFQSLLVWKISEVVDSISQEVDNGLKTAEKALEELEAEAKNLVNQAENFYNELPDVPSLGEVADYYDEMPVEIKKGAAIPLGLLQIAGGVYAEVQSGGIATVFAAGLAAHGVNNVYESLVYFYNGNEDAVGPVKFAYQVIAFPLTSIAHYIDPDIEKSKYKYYGNIAYYSADIALSVYGMSGKFVMGNPAKNQVLNKASVAFETNHVFKLEKNISSDFIRGYKTMANHAFFAEGMSDIFNMFSIDSEIDHIKHEKK
ncbi:hypothetical protein VA7868_03304 [Vibrio aerogenes CECT 7868]|uniref:DUF4225 domain-containing protein n=1 Tax=Vibrio aerogenes CECT 7868 TaxID=1216006 RepID=A0A1M5ZVH6_9VIBR|nr:DUF4225 domain-containing protein [Vibrio aerogenes]SHI28222.1 hypothetical protein VA7868_03304 [Vibrio aerogenes CECT 7868]